MNTLLLAAPVLLAAGMYATALYDTPDGRAALHRLLTRAGGAS